MDEKLRTSFSGLKTMHLNDQKAGMNGLHKETINKIIYEASKGTPYFTFQEKRQLSIDSKVKELESMIKNITETQRKESLAKMDALCQSLEKKRDLNHSIVHIDMDAFYAAVEMHDNPELIDKPMAVGSSSMLSTSNYHARKFGVRAAMPGFIAKKLCPDLVIVPCNFHKYRAVSNIIQSIVKEYDPHYSAASLDEVYLDLTAFIQKKHKDKLHEEYCSKIDSSDVFEKEDGNGSDEDSIARFSNCIQCAKSISQELRDKMAFEIVLEIREKIYKATALTASAGIAPNTMLAKVCSDQNKPNGQYQIISTADAVKSFISTLPVKKVSGIGPVQGQILNAIGIQTCADMWAQRDLVANLFSSNSVDFYMRVAVGIGSTTVRSDHVRKSIGNERTFREIFQPSDLNKMCEELCADLIEDMKSHNLAGKVIVLKFKTTDFETHTRNHSLPSYTANPEIIYKSAKRLLDAEISAAAPQHLKLRLMGVRMCNLVDADSISAIKKQQITLKMFLESKMAKSINSPSKSNETVSTEQLEARFEDQLNNDLDIQKISEYKKESKKPVNENACDESKSLNHILQISEQTNEESLTYFCPVCELNLRVNNLIELNDHIDNCLNRKEIKKILSAESQVAAKRKLLYLSKDNPRNSKIPRKEKRIEEYFR